MSTLTTIRNLGSIKRLLSNSKTHNDPQVQQTFDSINLTLEQHIHLVMECINTLEGIREEEAQVVKEEIKGMVEKLHQLI